jgi:hypothetical protein
MATSPKKNPARLSHNGHWFSVTVASDQAEQLRQFLRDNAGRAAPVESAAGQYASFDLAGDVDEGTITRLIDEWNAQG